MIEQQCPRIPLRTPAVLNLALCSNIVKHVTNGRSKNRGFIGGEKGNRAVFRSRDRRGESRRHLPLCGGRGDPLGSSIQPGTM